MKWLVALLLFATTVQAQENWLRDNRVALPVFLTLQGADALATERDQTQRFHLERNPLVPHTTAGRTAYFAGTAIAVVGASWLLHRRHPHAAKWLLWGAAGMEAYSASRSWGKF